MKAGRKDARWRGSIELLQKVTADHHTRLSRAALVRGDKFVIILFVVIWCTRCPA